MTRPKREIVPPPSAPTDVAQYLLDTVFTDDNGKLTTHRWRGDIYKYEPGVWAARIDDVVRHGVYTWLKECVYVTAKRTYADWSPNTTTVNRVIDALEALVFLDEHAEPPCWLRKRYPRSGLIPLQNCLLDLATRKPREHTRDHFNVTQLPFAYDPKARADEWIAFLRTLWPNDQESIDCLQEMFGYLVSGRLDMEKLFLLVGPKRAGKGTIMTAATALVGREYVVNPTLGSLAQNFGRAPLIGKSLAIIGDARIGGRESGSAVEHLLGISGQDGVSIDRKHKSAWNGLLPTRFVLLSNEVPHLSDASGTIESRFVILQLTESWLGREDPTLKAKFSRSRYLPGILNWSLDGYDRLYKQGHFTEPASAVGARETLSDLATPYLSFVADCCELGPGYEDDKDLVYQSWRNWCYLNGYDKPGNLAWFSKGLMSAFPSVRPGREGSGMRRRMYVGLKLRHESVPSSV